MKRFIVFFAITLGCERPAPKAQPAASASAASASVDAGVARRCLPVVAKECGCDYPCGVGTPDGDHWNVTQSAWPNTTLVAKIEPWCVHDQCTDAFAAQIVCDGICPRKPADSTCHFDANGVCRSAQ